MDILKQKIENILKSINIDNFEYDGLSQKEIRLSVMSKIHVPIMERLKESCKDFNWEYEKSIKNIFENFNFNDKIDIYGYNNSCDLHVIIEIDTYRSDQITKKFVSRYASTINENLIYVIVLYPNQHGGYKHEKSETEKYIKYINTILNTHNIIYKSLIYIGL